MGSSDDTIHANDILSEKQGLWCGAFEDVVVAAILDSLTLQKCKKKLLDYFPDEMSEDLSGWKLNSGFRYVEKKYHIPIVESIFKISFST